MHATEALTEADRLMTVCNSCRYCEGLCAVFPAMEMRRAFADGDLNYLANLCHGCGACHVDCQYAPPHEFAVNLPKTLAQVRNQSYAHSAWPRPLARLYLRNGVKLALLTAGSIAVFLLGFAALEDPRALYANGADFYSLMPHAAMAGLFGLVFVYAIVALAMGARAFWRDTGEANATLTDPMFVWQAMRDAGRLRYLDGGGEGCFAVEAQPDDRRRLFHHLTFYGFGLCFAATGVAMLYHYLGGREAPYPWWDLPVVLGGLGGVGLTVGPIGLFLEKRRREPELKQGADVGMDTAFLATLFLAGLTGLLLLVARETSLMGLLLAIHLGAVLALFLALPYGKFVHGLYRFLALVRYAAERKRLLDGAAEAN